MNSLVIETSTDTGSVALLHDGELVMEEIFQSGRGHAGVLFLALEKTLVEAGKQDILPGEVCVGVGPGGYSGLRVGISAALGCKLGRNIPAHGVHSALGYPGESYQVIHDARGAWIYARVGGGKLTQPPILLDREQLNGGIDPAIPIYCAAPLVGFDALPETPKASILGIRTFAPVGFLPLRPLYLKAPHVTMPKATSLWPPREGG